MKQPPPLARSALITGGAVRVGRAITLALARAGFQVVVHYHSSQRAAATLREELKLLNTNHALIQADLEKPGSQARLVDEALDITGTLDLLVNNASVFLPDDSSLADLAHMKLLNVDAPKKCMEAAIPHLEQSAGSIVNIADIAGIQPYSRYRAYSQTQSVLLQMTGQRAVELAPRGVRVNAVSPGTVLPPPGYSEEQVHAIRKNIPLGRIGTPQDIADGVLYLARAPFVTGHNLIIDGGRSLSRGKNKIHML